MPKLKTKSGAKKRFSRTASGKIKFKPAQRNGSAVDSMSIVHVMFQIAS